MISHHLQAFVSTKHWSTLLFLVTRGVFQGDTISPVFLMVFYPILKIVQSLSYPGVRFRIPIPNSNDLPEPGSTTYVEWNESNSNEPAGWYRYEVVAYSPNGAAQLFCTDGASEVVDLSTIKWNFARRSSKEYRNLDSLPPRFIPISQKRKSASNLEKSTEHRVK